MATLLMYMKRSPRLTVLLFCAVVLSIAFFPFLFLGRLFIDGDATLYYYPVFDFYHRAIVSGTSFLWNPSIFLGFPTYLSQSAGFLDPLNWALFHLPTFTAYHLRLVLDALLVMVFSYGVGRELNRSRTASLLIGMGYLLAFNWRYLSNVVIANSLFLLPCLFYAGLRLFRAPTERERWGWTLLMGAAIGWSFLSGYAQFTVYTVFVFFLFSGWYFVWVAAIQKTLRTVLRFVAYGGAILVVGCVVGLPQILPALTFTPLTVRSQGVAYEQATYKTVELGDLALFVFPDYLYFPYVSGGRKPLYVGALLFFLAVIGIREVIRRRDHAPDDVRSLRVFAALFLFCLVAALKWSPLYFLMQKLPLFHLFRFPYRWMYVGVWFLACLGAYGFDVVCAHPLSTFTKRFSSILLWCGVAFTSIVLALNLFGEHIWNLLEDAAHTILTVTIYGHFGFYKDVAHYRDALARGVDAWRESLSLLSPPFALPFLLVLGAIALLYAVSRGRITPLLFSRAGFALSVVTFFVVFMVQWPRTISVEAIHLQDPVQAALPDLKTGQYRYLPFMLAHGLQAYIPPQYTLSVEEVQGTAELQFASGWPNMNAYGGAASIDGYDPFVSVELLNVLTLIGSTHGGEEVTRALSPQEISERLISHLDVVGALSGKYIISGVPLTHANLHLIRVVPVSRYQVPLYLYENGRAVPRIYFAHATVNKENKSLEELSTENPRFMRETYLDCSACVSHSRDRTDTFEVIKDENGVTTVRTHTKGSRWLVVGDNLLPGWSAVVDDMSVPIIRANGMLMAIEVPPGDHYVSLTYEGVWHELKILRALGIVQ